MLLEIGCVVSFSLFLFASNRYQKGILKISVKEQQCIGSPTHEDFLSFIETSEEMFCLPNSMKVDANFILVWLSFPIWFGMQEQFFSLSAQQRRLFYMLKQQMIANEIEAWKAPLFQLPLMMKMKWLRSLQWIGLVGLGIICIMVIFN